MREFREIKKLKSNIGELIDQSPYKREFFRKRYNKTPNTISNWCTGKSQPTATELFDLAFILGVTVDELYDFAEEPSRKMRDLTDAPITNKKRPQN